MSEPLDETYFTWLYAQVASTRVRNRNRTFWTLARSLFTTEFVWFVPNDDNRVEDGRALRHEFLQERDVLDVEPDWLTLGCSCLEMMIGVSRRLEFEAEGTVQGWFWTLVDNLGLMEFTDAFISDEHISYIDDVLNRLVWRTYERNGRGGLFPLQNSRHDQREVEMWYQLNSYLLERR